MKLETVWVGPHGKGWIRDGIGHYIDRIKPLTTLSEIFVDEEKSQNLPERIRQAESSRILKLIADRRNFVIACDEKGRKFDSRKFAEFMGTRLHEYPGFCFVTGGAYGLNEEVRKSSGLSLSFSDFTLPHKLFRIFLLEQLYRSLSILNNHPYHND